MAVRRTHKVLQGLKRKRRQRDKRLERLQNRGMQLERLEQRQLLAVGPQLVGIQPNNGELLKPGQVRSIAPTDLTFQFDEGTTIDANTLNAIKITRSGFDGSFNRASVFGDFNTNGAVVIEFSAATAGPGANGITINFTKGNIGATRQPILSVSGETINVMLNTRAGASTRATDLITAINGNPQTAALVTASVRRGSNTADISTPVGAVAPLVLGGYNTASATTQFNTPSLEVQFRARTPGVAQNGITIEVTKRNFGQINAPTVTVNGTRISVVINTFQQTFPAVDGRTTVQEFINAINNNAAASALVTASLRSGTPNTVIATAASATTNVVLGGATDVEIIPGAVLLGDSPREVVFRFRETLPDDLYRIDVLGAGAGPILRNVSGGAIGDTTDDNIDNGADFALQFELDLGANVVSVVPQPIVRNAGGQLTQRRNIVEVYFNNDDMHPTIVQTGDAGAPTVVNPNFYQLIFTNDTATNTDDVVYKPVSVKYNPATDRAELDFGAPLEALGSGPGTFRLRIGTDEAAPLPPILATSGPGAGGGSTIGAEIPNGTLIDNDIAAGNLGQFSFDVATGGASGVGAAFAGRGGVTAQGNSLLFNNVNFVFDFLNYVSVGGNVIDLGSQRNPRRLQNPTDVATQMAMINALSNQITLPATLIGDDLVRSEGFFLGDNGQQINWLVETHMDDGENTVFNTVTFTTANPLDTLGNLQFVNYLDEDVAGVADDILHLRGTPGQADFRAFTLDNTERVGFSQGGVYTPGPGLLNATYIGFAANTFDDLQRTIERRAGATAPSYSLNGVITNLPAINNDPLANVFGDPLNNNSDVTTAFAWTVNPSANTATITTFLELIPQDPILGQGPVDFVETGSSFDTAIDIQVGPRAWDTGQTMVVTGNGAAFKDGQAFTITDNLGATVRFEFNDAAVGGGVAQGSAPIAFSSTTPTSAANMRLAIATAINNSAALNVTATIVGNTIELDNDIQINIGADIGGMSLTTQGIVISAAIEPQNYGIEFPGANDEPGNRELRAELDNHLSFDGNTDITDGVETIFYNFRSNYGSAPNSVPGQPRIPLFNLITETQKQRAREIFEYYSTVLGVQFVESPSSGLTVATGDLRFLPGLDLVPTGPGGVTGIAAGGTAVMDNQDNNGPGDDLHGAGWFRTAMHEIGHLLGLGHSLELPPITIQGQEPILGFNNPAEPDFPGDGDIVHGQHLHRPESKDIDLYRFQISETGLFSAEIFAERRPDEGRPNDRLLDARLALFRQNEDGTRELLAQNDDYFSEDPFLELSLTPGVYFVGVSASGNDQYDPSIEDSGIGGTSQGPYDLRLNFRPDADNTIKDATGTALDGDADGVPGGVYDYWFRAAAPRGLEAPGEPRTIFVDRSAPAGGNGSLAAPLNNIANANVVNNAFAVARPGDIVRIVGNGGADGNLATVGDNLSYEIGFNGLGQVLRDGSTMEVPKNVTVMVDSAAIIKLRRARIGVGSSEQSITRDRSGGALQILGTPNLLESDGQGDFRIVTDIGGRNVPGSVFLTSIFDAGLGIDTNPEANKPAAAAGNWGGISFRNDIDRNDGRFDWELQGIFLNHVNNAMITYGGGVVVVNSKQEVIRPVNMVGSRPTVSFNTITRSADAAMTANPNAFEETNFHSPRYQAAPFSSFTSDYSRVGPDIHRNRVVDNTLNGLLVSIDTLAGDALEKLTVSGRFDDTDIVHVLKENLTIQGTPGGPLTENRLPQVQLVTLNPQVGGSLAVGTYEYRMVFVDRFGTEGVVSNPTAAVTLAAPFASIRFTNLPVASGDFVSRRLYRSNDGGATYQLVAELNATNTTYVDDGVADATFVGGPLNLASQGIRERMRPNGSLVIDPGTVVKLEGAKIETTFGGQLLAEGLDGQEIIFTSVLDDRYGAGGTFDTSGNQSSNLPDPGEWAGIFAGHLTRLSLDHSVIAYAGGISRVEGNFTGFNALEIHQAEARVAHSLFEFNANGLGGQAPANRFGRGFNEDATIFVRGAQPVIIENTLINNDGAAININANALNFTFNTDPGRSTGAIDQFPGFVGNQGPLVRGNLLDNNGINGMVVRGETIATQSVWDDTDIVHVVFDEIYVPDFHTYGGLRIESSSKESLVVKLLGADAGFTATGRPLDIEDRIGGSVQIVGQPGAPVVLTSLNDCTVGAGFTPDGKPQNNTGGICSTSSSTPIFAPMIDQFGDSAPNVDQWQLVADSTGTIIVTVYEDDGATIDIDGINPTVAPPGVFTTISLTGVAPGSTHVFNHTISPSQTISHYRPEFRGVSQVYLLEDRTSPNDVFNSTSGTGTQIGSNIELGFDARFDPLPSPFADTTWFYDLDEGDTFNWRGFFDDFPGGVDAAAIELIDPSGTVIQTATQQPLLPIPGTSFTTIVQPGQAGFWAVKITAPDPITPFAGHYLMDVEVTDSTGARDAVKSQRHYLLPGSLLDPNQGAAGDWRSVRFDEFSHDRNVGVVTELEPRNAVSPGNNADPSNAQFIGALARNEKAGDDNLRLGFEVHGQLNSRDDVDVYSFDAEGQTEIWLDIDRSTHALDAVIEIVDGFGNVIARSDNSFAESTGGESLFQTPFIPTSDLSVKPLQKDAYTVGQPRNRSDRWGTNPRDPGMRVVLPGAAGEATQYFVRVRSSSPDLNNLAGGRSLGAYQLQLRLAELDEIPGSTVQFADIRFASNGVEIFGQPGHSPLAGEANEDSTANDTLANAQALGNLLNTSLATLSIAGNLSNANDIDFYTFDVTYDSIQSIGGFSNPNIHQTVVFDLDYADGFARANTVLTVFDSNGNIVLSSLDSNIADDQPSPLRGANVDNLAAGSGGTQDGFIGPVELPVGTYFVAVSSNAQIPAELGQSILQNPANALHRLEPVNSLVRIAEDRISGNGGSNIPASPRVPNLASSEVPWFLGDVTLFVSQDTGNNQTNIFTVDPFTGTLENVVGRFGRDVGDIAMRHNGNLHAYSLDLEDNQQNDAQSGNYLLIDPSNTPNLAVQNLGDDGIVTFEFDPANPGTAVVAHPVGGGTRVGWGIQFRGLAYDYGAINNQQRGFAIGDRGPLGIAFSNGVTDTRNVLYQIDPDTGVAFSATAPDRTGNARATGAGTQIRERGVIDTDIDNFQQANAPTNAIQVPEVTTVATSPTGDVAIFNVRDGDIFTLEDMFGQRATFEINTGPELTFVYNPPGGLFVRDGQTFQLDDGGGPITLEFNTGGVLVVNAQTGDPNDPNPIADGDSFTLRNDVGQQLTFEFDNGTGPPIAAGRIGIQFQNTSSQAAIVAAIVGAINQQNNLGFGVTAVNLNNRISLISANNQNSIQNVSSVGITAEGGQGITAGNIGINVEETSTSGQFVLAMQATFNNPAGQIPTITLGVDGPRMNFLGAETMNLATPTPVTAGVFTEVVGSDGLISDPTFFEVPVLAQFTAFQLAQEMVNAINAQNVAPVQAARANDVVQLRSAGAFFDPGATDDPPFSLGGVAPGGDITGITFIGSQMFGVSDAGGLFRIFNPTSNGGAISDFIETSGDLTGINFQGLVSGPPNVEGGRYANTLFGIDGGGRMYAFNTAGALQPIFADGQSSVQLNLPTFGQVNGLAFSNLDHNLWHSTPQRNTDAGHGLQQAFDGSRVPPPNAGNSLYFGFETPARNGVPGGRLDPGNRNNINFPGGAHGVFETESFSLEGYAPADKPVAYVSYFLETEGVNADLNTPTLMRDSFRIYASGGDGQWHMVETNNSDRGVGFRDDEFDRNPFGDGIFANVQEAFDNTGSWRQLRIPLEPFAGQSDVRLRIEYATAGSVDLGNSNTGGADLRAIDGADLRDGDTFEITDFGGGNGLQRFEFDLGYTLVAPTGARLQDGQTFTLDSLTFEFEDQAIGNGVSGNNIAIPFNDANTAADVAQAIVAALGSGAIFGDVFESFAIQNDTIGMAAPSPLTGGVGRFQVQGEIGDNPALASPGIDVDLIEVFLNAGDTITASISPTSSLDSVLRAFDSTGMQVALSAPAGNGSQIAFTAMASGVHYIGVSGGDDVGGNPNTTYDPFVAGSGVAASSGTYTLDIQSNPISTDTQGNRINLVNAQTAVLTNNSAVTIDGAPGVRPGANPVFVNSGMLAAGGVATAMRTALRDFYAPNATIDVIKSYRDVVKIHSPVGITRVVSNQGPLLLSDRLYGDEFGAFNAGTNLDNTVNQFNPGFQRGQNNNVEGVYIDDIIIGFAERGEMSTGASGNASFIPNPLAVQSQINVGPYQLEIRRADQYGFSDPLPLPTLFLTESFDTNDRFAQQQTLVAPSADQVFDGQTFRLGDGLNTVTFEYNDVTNPNTNDGVTPGHFAIPFNTALLNPATGNFSPETSIVMAARIRDAINSDQVQAVINVTAGLSDGRVTGSLSTSNRINLYGNAILQETTILSEVNSDQTNDTTTSAVISPIAADGAATFHGRGGIGDVPNPLNPRIDRDLIRVHLGAGDRLEADVHAAVLGSPLDAVLRIFDANGAPLAINDNTVGADPSISFVAPSAGFYFVGVSGAGNGGYNPTVAPAGDPLSAPGSTGFYEIDLRRFDGIDGIAVDRFDDFGDTNTFRPQGQILIRQSTISHSAGFGIVSNAGQRDRSDIVPLAGDELPHSGPVRVLEELNGNRLVPGVTITNNILAFNNVGGIQIRGDANAGTSSLAPVPFDRVINNTIVGEATGAGAGVGIEVSQNASPTIMNNILAGLQTGISVDGTSSSTVIGGSVYYRNTNNTTGAGLGDFPLVVAAPAAGDPDPMFVDPQNGNFYLAPGSVAIDSAIDSLEDRPTLVSVKDPLGIGLSPVKAPDRDITGQLRVDDTSVEPIFGFGNPPFRDRGAIDRADFAGPTTVLINPRDNDAEGVDTDSALTFVSVSNTVLSNFQIQIVDGVEPSDPSEGIGVDDTTVTAQKVALFQDGKKLVLGIDYSFNYDPTNNIVQLIPLAGIWEADSNYLIELVNTDRHVIAGVTGADFAERDLFTITNLAGQTTTFEFDAGYTLIVPVVGAGVGGISDGQSFTINNNGVITRFEFDTNNVVQSGSVRVPFTLQSTRDQIANAIVTAVAGAANVNLQPTNIGNGQVHLGGTVNHILNTQNTQATQTGLPGAQTQNAVAVPFVPSAAFTGEPLADALAAAINGAGLAGVSARSLGGEVLIEGASSVVGVSNVFIESIRDLAGNDLKANRVNGRNEFTIFIGSGLDFGDAPDGPYQTLLASDGPRHSVVTGFHLGQTVDSDIDGQPSPDSDGDDFNGDDEDGIISLLTGTTNGFVGGFIEQAELVVRAAGITPTRQGFLDMWVDFNQDGDFLDAGEKVINSHSLVNGLNTLNKTTVPTGFNSPGNFLPGSTVARLRLSSTGGLSPTGAAIDGEVEDHLITLNANPYQNPVNRFDVDGDGFVAPNDALILINLMNSGTLPAPPNKLPNPPVAPLIPPPFIDVDGDGFSVPTDIINVINELNRIATSPPPPSGEGEAEGEAVAELIVGPLAVSPAGDGGSASTDLAALAASQFVAAPTTSGNLGRTAASSTPNDSELYEWTWRNGDRTADAAHSVVHGKSKTAPLAAEDLDSRQLALDELLDDLVAGEQTERLGDPSRDEWFARFGL